jgi:hypothetical protein
MRLELTLPNQIYMQYLMIKPDSENPQVHDSKESNLYSLLI